MPAFCLAKFTTFCENSLLLGLSFASGAASTCPEPRGAKASPQPASFFREMDQRCPRDNRPAPTTVAKSSASASLNRDPRDEPSTSSEKTQGQAPDKPKPLHFSPSDKKSRREMKEQRRQEEERGRNSGTPTIRVNTTCTSGGSRNGRAHSTSNACKDLNHITIQINVPNPGRTAKTQAQKPGLESLFE